MAWPWTQLFAVAVSVVIFASNSDAADMPPQQPFEKTKDFVGRHLEVARKEGKFLVVLFGGADGRISKPTLGFEKGLETWKSQSEHASKVSYLRANWLGGFDYLNQEAKHLNPQNLFPSVLLFAPDGTPIAFETGRAWGNDTEAEVCAFLDKWLLPHLKAHKPEK